MEEMGINMILVTGGTGFVGSELLRTLVNEGFEVAATKREGSNFDRVKDIYDRVHWVDSSDESLDDFFENKRPEGIIHCATGYGRNGGVTEVFSTNVMFPLGLLQRALNYGVDFFINTDSFFVRELDGSWKEGESVYLDAYTKTKFAFRELAREMVKGRDLKLINMELQHIYGANDAKGKFTSFLINELKSNAEVIELSAGLQKRDWTYVTDVEEAYVCVVKSITKFTSGELTKLEVGTGVMTSLREFCEKALEFSGASTRLDFGKRPMNAGELMESAANPTALKELGWAPKIDLNEGIRRLFD